MNMRKTLMLLPCLAASWLAGCATGASNSSGSNPLPSPSGVTVTVSPSTANVRAGDSYTFSAVVSGASNSSVTWFVDGTAGGSASTGTIDASGKYSSPSTLPSPNTVTIRATSSADSSASGSSAVTLLNPTPVLTGINPSSVNAGNFTLTVTGSKFVSGAKVLFSGSALSTTVNSSTQLTATGSISSAGAYSITVRNPDPGSSTSSSASFQVNGSTQASGCSGMSLGQGASLNGFRPFPDDSLWNKDISAASVDSNSSAIINFIGANTSIHADFGAGLYNNSSIGIPYLIVGASQGLVNINYQAYGDESDPGPMPIPVSAPVEGYPNPGSGDRHVLVLDNSNCFLYELYGSYPQSTTWNADSGAIWDLQANSQRPYGWTSADAAGLPIFPGLLRYDEVAAGQIKHAIRFTLSQSRAAFTPPATHWAANTSNAGAPPMGMRMRLKSSFNISGYSAANQVILTAMKKYGMIMADNGSSMYISGAPDDRWNNDDLHNLGNLKASDFEVVQMNPVYTTVPTGAAPQISTFSASSTSISAATPVTLSWQVTGASYVIVSPSIGVTRATSAGVAPAQTTTYTLYAANAYGQTKSTVTITVH